MPWWNWWPKKTAWHQWLTRCFVNPSVGHINQWHIWCLHMFLPKKKRLLPTPQILLGWEWVDKEIKSTIPNKWLQIFNQHRLEAGFLGPSGPKETPPIPWIQATHEAENVQIQTPEASHLSTRGGTDLRHLLKRGFPPGDSGWSFSHFGLAQIKNPDLWGHMGRMSYWKGLLGRKLAEYRRKLSSSPCGHYSTYNGLEQPFNQYAKWGF